MAHELKEAFVQAVRSELPADLLSLDEADRIEYGRDWTRTYAPAPSAVAFPRSGAEVATLLRLCSQHRVPVVPSGGRTGLAGGAVAASGELVLSLSRMNTIGPVDEIAQTVRVQAGAVLQAVHERCAEHGLLWPIDLAAKGSCQIGGNLATNAGGVKVLRYGLTRQWVLGLQVATASGELLELNGALEKNNTGTDLRQLFIGSEGTLGVITEATLKLVRQPAALYVLLFQLPDLQAVLRLFRAARRAPLVLQAFEFFTQRCLELVCAQRGLRLPFPPPGPELAPSSDGSRPCYALVELEGAAAAAGSLASADLAALETWFGEVLDSGLALDGVLAQSAQQAAELWAYRESISESLSRAGHGIVHKNDVALPVASLVPFCAEVESFFAAHYPGWPVFTFGHIGDGNLHINVLKPEGLPTAEFRARTSEVDRDLFERVRAHRGSISAEHGIGLLKKAYLRYSRTPAELALLRAIKSALDPNGILNPGKIFD
ncbi:MAG: FAD-binding oxidoreductase [Polyangia bacterium]